MGNALRFVGKRIRRLHKWEEDISTTTWAEKNVYLGSDVSPITGMLRLAETPYLEEVFRDFDNEGIYLQALCFSTQTAKTTAMLIAMTKALSTDPSRMQFTIKNTSDTVSYIQEKVAPFLRGVKTLKTKMVDLAEDTKKKTRATSIEIIGGGISITGTTASERRSKSVKYLFMDEVALYAKGVVVELIGRTKAFERYGRKVMLCSSLLYENDEMDTAYNNCEKKLEWNTCCPSCGDYFYAGSDHLKFLTKTQWKVESGQTEETFEIGEYRREALTNVYLECPHCQHRISNFEKDDAILRKKYKFMPILGSVDGGSSIGYRVNALGSRISSFESIASIWINADHENDPATISQFFIDYFNEYYQVTSDAIEANQLLVLGNGLPKWVVPEDTVKIYMGVDVQKDSFWLVVTAYCYGNAAHVIWSGEVQTYAEVEDIWVYGQNLTDAKGEPWMISAMGIDRRGYNEGGVSMTQNTDHFVEYMTQKWKVGDNNRIFATMGMPALTGDKAFSVISSKDLSTNRSKVDIKIIKLSNIYLKSVVSRNMERTIKKGIEGEECDYSANLFYINQEEIDADRAGTNSKSITRQLTSEAFTYAKNPRTGKVDAQKTWVRQHKDNHLFDCMVICTAFAEMDKISLAIKQSGYEDYKDLIEGMQ